MEASASLIFIQRTTDWRRKRVVAISLTEGGAHRLKSAFPMELLALTAADLLVRKLGLNAVIFSDCTAALKSLGITDAFVTWQINRTCCCSNRASG